MRITKSLQNLPLCVTFCVSGHSVLCPPATRPPETHPFRWEGRPFQSFWREWHWTGRPAGWKPRGETPKHDGIHNYEKIVPMLWNLVGGTRCTTHNNNIPIRSLVWWFCLQKAKVKPYIFWVYSPKCWNNRRRVLSCGIFCRIGADIVPINLTSTYKTQCDFVAYIIWHLVLMFHCL